MQLKEKNSRSPKAQSVSSKENQLKLGFWKIFFYFAFCPNFSSFWEWYSKRVCVRWWFLHCRGNKLTKMGVRGIPQIFKSHTFYNNDGSGYSYRPVALTTFAIENQFLGENPHASHFISVLLYALCIVILFSLLRKWFNSQGNWFSFFICLLFLVHPLHTEVVDNIKCRDELLTLFLYFLHFMLYGNILKLKSGCILFYIPYSLLQGCFPNKPPFLFILLFLFRFGFLQMRKIWFWKK